MMWKRNDPSNLVKVKVTVKQFVCKYHLGHGANCYQMQYETLSCDFYSLHLSKGPILKHDLPSVKNVLKLLVALTEPDLQTEFCLVIATSMNMYILIWFCFGIKCRYALNAQVIKKYSMTVFVDKHLRTRSLCSVDLEGQSTKLWCLKIIFFSVGCVGGGHFISQCPACRCLWLVFSSFCPL